MTYLDDSSLPQLSAEEFEAELATTRPYTLCILKAGPKFEPPGPDRGGWVFQTIWQHGKRNAALHKAGLLPVVCPVADGSEVAGVGILDASLEDADRILSDDPAIKAQILTYELHPTRSFPLANGSAD
jgi:hypothetical protein